MKRISVREGNLPEKIKHLALNPMVKKTDLKPPEVWECNDPNELMEYCQERNAVKQVLKPFKAESGGEDGNFYVAAFILEEMTESGLYIETNKLLFAKATPEFLRNQQRKYGEGVEEEMKKRDWNERS